MPFEYIYVKYTSAFGDVKMMRPVLVVGPVSSMLSPLPPKPVIRAYLLNPSRFRRMRLKLALWYQADSLKLLLDYPWIS